MTQDRADFAAVDVFDELRKAAELYDEYVRINLVSASLAATEFLSSPPRSRDWCKPMGVVMTPIAS